jgi:hypothetical protein
MMKMQSACFVQDLSQVIDMEKYGCRAQTTIAWLTKTVVLRLRTSYVLGRMYIRLPKRAARQDQVALKEC